MQNIHVTHGFVRKLTKNIRDAYGREVPHTKAMELVADALGWQAGPLMNALKSADTATDGVAKAPAVTFNPKDVPELHGLGSLDQAALEGLRKIGAQKTGLVLITGATGSGKTLMANTLLKQWARDTGLLGATTGQCMEYEIGGKVGDGMVVPFFSHRREAFRDAIPTLRTYNPAFILFDDHLHGGDIGRRLVSRLNDLMDAIEESRERVVVVSAYGGSSESFIREMATELSDSSPLTFEDAGKHFRNSLSAAIDVRARWKGHGSGHSYKADVVFNDLWF